jgi:hypothetical protein
MNAIPHTQLSPPPLSLSTSCRQRANESSHLLRYQFSDVMPSLRYTTCVPHETSLHVRGVMAVTLVPFGATSECARQTLTVRSPGGQGLTTPAWTSGSTRRARSDTFRSALESFGDRHFRGAQEKTAPGCESSSPLLHGMVQSCSLENGAVWKYTVKKCKQSRSFLHCTARQHARTARTPANNLRTITFSQITGKPSSSPS